MVPAEFRDPAWDSSWNCLPAAQQCTDYYVYWHYTPPGVSGAAVAVGAWVKDYGGPEWGDEIEDTSFLLQGPRFLKAQITISNHGGPNDPTPNYIDVHQHPQNPLSTGPVEPRTIQLVTSADLGGYGTTTHRNIA